MKYGSAWCLRGLDSTFTADWVLIILLNLHNVTEIADLLYREWGIAVLFNRMCANTDVPIKHY